MSSVSTREQTLGWQSGLPLEVTYNLHGFDLVVRSNERGLFEALDSHLGYYRHAAESASTTIRVDLVAEDASVWDARLSRLRHDPGCRFLGELNDGAGVFANFRLGTRQMILRERDIIAVAPGMDDAQATLWVTCARSCDASGQGLRKKASGDQFDWETIVDLVKGLAASAAGMEMIHAALLDTPRGGIVVAGNSGCGKTTTAAALARAGATLLTDDLCLVQTAADGFRMGGILMPLRFIGQAPESLAGLEASLGQECAGPKSVLQVDAAARSRRLQWTGPRAIFLLEGRPGLQRAHSVEPLAPSEACGRLLGFFVDPLTWFRRVNHLEVASQLTGACKVYRLTPGSDLRSLANTLFACV